MTVTHQRSVATGVMLAGIALAAAQNGERGIVPEDVIQARPAARTATPVRTKPQYQALDPQIVASLRRQEAASEMGVTIWRLRPASAKDAGARILIQEASQTVEWTPIRVLSNTRLDAGDRVRLTLESPERGYLYVIDRERYASGERGKPYLIFPTARTRNGDNQVMGGKLIDIPAQSDQPNFFTLRRSRPDQAEEELTVLLTPQPIEGINIGPEALLLAEEQVSAWEKQWGRKPEVFELSGGAGRAWTQAEQNAAAGGTRLLTQDDPPPQTVYRVAVKPGEPLALQVRLRYSPK